MYIGDILLFGVPDHADHSILGIIETMKALPDWRLNLGGAIGPFAAILYCIGFYGLSLGVKKKHSRLGTALFLLFSTAIIYGGTYHSHYPQLVRISQAQPLALEYLNQLTIGAILPMSLANFLFVYLVIANKTYYYKHILPLSPLPLMLLTPILKHLPPPLYVFITGGWNNILFIAFFIAAIYLQHSKPQKQI